MALKALIAGTVSSLITSDGLRDARRALAAARRRLRRERATVHWFHQPDDPYAQLLLQALPGFAARYDVAISPQLAAPPEDSAAPDRPRLQAWSRRDAATLAAATGLVFADAGEDPDPSRVSQAYRACAAAFRDGDAAASIAAARRAGDALWMGDASTLARLPMADDTSTRTLAAAGSTRRRELGHYLGATLHFEGEWYWGVDRLHYLEERLTAAGLARTADTRPVVSVPRVMLDRRPTNASRPTLHFFCSLRSPYTWLAVDRVRRLAANYGAELRLRYVLPMVMRGLPVPREKRIYILLDTRREAAALGLPFGRIVDPVGRPTERGLAVLHRAVGAGLGPEFLESFMRGVWAEGIDAGSDDGLERIAARVGLDAGFVAAALADEAWRSTAQANRDEMLALGLWGVPSFRVDARPAVWGQDRLWQIERDLVAATKAVPR